MSYVVMFGNLCRPRGLNLAVALRVSTVFWFILGLTCKMFYNPDGAQCFLISKSIAVFQWLFLPRNTLVTISHVKQCKQ